jgi:LuxR family transcriptional regulator, maltose regulon positive regulatory protein
VIPKEAIQPALESVDGARRDLWPGGPKAPGARDRQASGTAILGPRRREHTGGLEQPGGLLEAKLGIPRPAFPILPRARLTHLLDGTTGHRVTLLCAPAGSGKTTACAAWAHRREGRPRIGWLSLDRADNDPGRFRSYLLASLRGAGISSQESLRGAELASHDDFALMVAKAAERFSEPVVLILDNIHELTGDVVLDWLKKLVRYAPPGLSFVLSGRRTPPLQLARLRVSGDLADIDAEALACTRAEAAAYFSLLGIPAGPAGLDEVLRQTEGWMAGLRLAAIGTQTWPVDHRNAGIAGNGPLVADYLRDEILADHDARTRAFLLRASVTPKLTGDLADAVTNTVGAARLLDRLNRQNSLVYRSGPGRAWYRFHPLLRGLLLAELRREIPEEIPVLLQRAAGWYAQHGMPAEAVKASVDAQGFVFAAQVLAENDIDILMSRGPAELEHMLAHVPPDAAADPAFSAARAAGRLWSGDPDGARVYLEAAENALGHAAGPAQAIVRSKLIALRVMHASTQQCTSPDMLAQARAGARQMGHGAGVPAQHKALGMLWWALGVAHTRRSELPSARNALRLAERELRTAGLPVLQARTRAWWSLCAAWQGALGDAARAAAEVLNTDEPAALATRHIALLALALVNLMRDELAVAHRLLDQIEYQDHVPIPGEPPVVTSARVVRTRTFIGQGDIAAARASLAKLEAGSGPFTPAVAGFIASLQGELAVQSGARELRRDVIAKLTEGGGPSTPGGNLILSWLSIADDNPGRALRAAERCLAVRADDAKLHDRVSALLAAAVACRRLKRTGRATGLLEQALLLAEPEEMYRPFLDGGLPARSVLTVLVQPASRGARFAHKVLRRFDIQPPGLPALPDGAIPALSHSELSVLRLLPSDLTNEEIGEALFLSVNTIKTHLRNIYRKLGARSRREAAALARYHGLVS